MQTFAPAPLRAARHRYQIACGVLGFLLTAGVSVARAQGCPAGVWTFVGDSSGATADVGTIVTFTFGGANAAFVAAGPGGTLNANGPCSATAGRITLALATIGKSATNAPFTLAGDTLTLPFNVFSDGPGTSTWRRATAGGRSHTDGSGGNGGGSGATGGGGGSTGSGSGNGAGGSGGTGSGSGNGGGGGTGSGSGSGATGPGGTGSGSTGGGGNAGNGSGSNTTGGHPTEGGPTHANPYAPYVGDWVGSGWSYETRFRQSRQQFVSQVTHGLSDPLASREGIDGTVMELIVEHVTHFAFTIDASGHVTGKGGIVYNMVPNLCGLAALTKQANESINMMKQLPAIYKFANELGTAAISAYNKEWVENENRMASSVESLGEDVGKVKPPIPGIDTSYKPRAELDEELAAKFNQMGESRDTRALALQTIMRRCTGSRAYTFIGGFPCTMITDPAIEHELGSPAKEIAKFAQEKLIGTLNDITKDEIEKVNRVEKHQELSCGQIGPGTLEQFTDQMKEKFTDLAQEETTGALTGGLVGYVSGNLATGVAGGLSVPTDLLLSIPGVTQVNYWYRGLVDGPDKSPQAERQFDVDGHIEVNGGTAKLYLNMGQLTGGPSQLTVEYMVNFKWDRGQFPAFSPFLEQPADISRRGAGAANLATATFHAAGTHRNGVAPWHEYEYNWVAHRVTAPVTEQPR